MTSSSDNRLGELLYKYDVFAPRYTSYPTVPAWTGEVSSQDYREALLKCSSQDPFSLYFHLPFCENLCHFCGCTQVITKDHERSKSYTEVLKAELKKVRSLLPKKLGSVTQIHFGGGTPNFFHPMEISTLLQLVRNLFDVESDAELAIEIHPKTSLTSFNQMLASQGFNRISLGIQDLDPKVQSLINRNQNFEITKLCMDELRSNGLSHFNLDLVYGLPGQNEQGWEKTLAQVLQLSPNRLAVYSYAHVPWVRPVQRKFLDSDLPSPQLKVHFFEMAYKTFLDAGFSLIGMDHFARGDDELTLALKTEGIHRNFMGYSTRSDAHQIGFGMSAISYVNGGYFQNQKELKKYTEMINRDELATFRGHILKNDDFLRKDVITHMMCQGSINYDAFNEKWGKHFHDVFPEAISQLNSFEKDGLVSIDNHGFRVVGEGFLFLRNIATLFDAYLENIRKGATNPTFSRTI
ncbi:MAG: oxygen-independent coproporphyrinogen III oxidase [Deltaproteobacteria bacterium RIFCSPLOWO2_12_FULL_40_28]|nr:MAG: oxygen-independent coproporphyrinogen III oxidase [Deltaproteobacteria bacterium RIFCSPHIGHO2_02_FULL_40_28]OGQ19710.1 MAG: oxygen-independent coproporphyrinogen III oxidase [Deltaproteobacteria bacterium RIFCSPHIGHO2_12_FULL_40_32]OGQ40987.1 MAG: oxygen-independent coproporphyrinogen III oxidase [Deltaproteobacteria bacterium RIFCSPLOWO2_02_FULL_40_36]OGQ54102.1 MAG: oxygen-independent coproporphyrinogen III oxidase [Deltaproteobacteria bacterium RIFCSPLOWO2_12_FULL_40_28]